LWSKLNNVVPTQNIGDRDYYYCDEGWFNSLLKQIFLISKEKNISNKEVKLLIVMIETFIFRRTNNIVSLFKRYDMYLGFFEEIQKMLTNSSRNITDNREFIKECVALIADGELEDFRDYVKEKYEVAIFIKMTPPKTIKFDNEGNSELKIMIESEKIVPAQKVSPYLESLITMNHVDQLLHIFLVGNGIKKSSELQVIKKELQQCIKDKYMEANNSELSENESSKGIT
jgi:hypothetical protein